MLLLQKLSIVSRSCEKQNQEAQFLLNSTGQIVSLGDVVCLANAKRLLPGRSFEEYCARIASDTEFAKAAETSREAIVKESEDRDGCVLPLFIPGSELAEASLVGHEVYTKAALLSEVDIVRETSKSAKELGLVPFVTEWGGQTTQQTQQFFLVSRAGLSPETLAKCRTVKLFQSMFIRNEKLWITPETQLSKSQPKDVQAHLLERYNSKKRPSGLVSPGGLQTLSDLQELAQILENKKMEILQNQTQSTDPANALGEENAAQVPGLLAGLADDDDEKRQGKRKKAAKAKTTPPSTLPALMDDASTRASTTAGPGSDALVALPDKNHEVASAGKSDTSKSNKRGLGVLPAMDSEMRQVAELHLTSASGRNASAKGLCDLTASNFVVSGTDHTRSHALVAATWLSMFMFCQGCDVGRALNVM